jgi:hypothetical protein
MSRFSHLSFTGLLLAWSTAIAGCPYSTAESASTSAPAADLLGKASGALRGSPTRAIFDVCDSGGQYERFETSSEVVVYRCLAQEFLGKVKPWRVEFFVRDNAVEVVSLSAVAPDDEDGAAALVAVLSARAGQLCAQAHRSAEHVLFFPRCTGAQEVAAVWTQRLATPQTQVTLAIGTDLAALRDHGETQGLELP